MLAPALLTLAAVAALLIAERAESRVGVWIAKPLASTGFVAAAVALGGFERATTGDGYALGLVAGLVLCWWGDVLLVPRDRPAVFRAGVLAFLLGHVAFAAAFVSRGVDALAVVAAALALITPVIAVLRWLAPSVPADLRVAVRAYVLVIAAMLVAATGTAVEAGGATIAIGALMFCVSDLSVARDRFVAPGFANAAWGLPLYYAAQLVLASTLRLT